jgi:putative endonuclease
MRTYHVYILASRTRALYVGVTGNLARRLRQHRAGDGSAFTRRYRITRLVYVEDASRAIDAIRREKELKGWTRARKLALIASANPGFDDLASGWLDEPEREQPTDDSPCGHAMFGPATAGSHASAAPRAGDPSLRSG